MAFDKKAYMKEYREKNKEAIATKQKTYNEKNKEVRAAYYEKNKEVRAVKAKVYAEKNKEAISAYQKEYRETIKGRFKKYQFSANSRGYDFPITLDEFSTFWQKPCHYCGDAIETIGLDRIDNNIGYNLDNLVSCCTFCNLAKLDWTEEYFLDKIRKIAHRHPVQEIHHAA